MSAAVALMLEGMPSPRDLCLHRAAGRVVVLVGSTVVAEYGDTDLAMRNMVIVTLRRLGFPGWRVAEVFGLTPTYVSRLKTVAARQGVAVLGGQGGPGRPRALGEDQQDLARQWREQGESDLEIGRRLGVAGTTVARRLAAGTRARQRGRMPAGGRKSLRSRTRLRNLAGTWNWLRNRGRSPGRGQIQGRRRSNRTRSRSPDAWPGWPLSRARRARGGTGPVAVRRHRRRGGRAADHRRSVLVAVCGGDAAARVHGPGRGGAGAGVRGRARRTGRPPMSRWTSPGLRRSSRRPASWPVRRARCCRSCGSWPGTRSQPWQYQSWIFPRDPDCRGDGQGGPGPVPGVLRRRAARTAVTAHPVLLTAEPSIQARGRSTARLTAAPGRRHGPVRPREYVRHGAVALLAGLALAVPAG